jgi:hypothetical protein
MCSTEEEKENNSCCSKEDDFSVQIKKQHADECCEIKVIDSSVKDYFLINKSETKTEVKVLSFFTILNNNVNTNSSNGFDFRTFNSSPPLIESELYILNSILLI